ncbi:MAG: hypothetical protein MUO31_05890, partial [Thermodesulfovibrionales bacterium]|nr:hypothetical protein [Thermodesulfovibrionales bacterium]
MKKPDRCRIRPRTPFLCSCFIFLICFPLPVSCYASSPQDEYKKMQQEIRSQREKLEQVKNRESSILSDIEQT